mmetsp:Transcript_33996/g.83314  ORF Transcript_33996/g.83314 Transcript_33996/m.83314 type:complete len:355 (-) Transcript_33996:105-1169(-)
MRAAFVAGPWTPTPSRARSSGVCERGGGARRSVVKAAVVAGQERRAVEPRIGHGFDLHRLEPGLPFVLGGVALEHDRGCAAHSDGDVVFHTVVDAVLGALSMPDIGQLFSDKDPKWKGASSDVFMRATTEIMQNKGYEIGNIDVTIILERPKVSPHKETIRSNIAELLQTDRDNVNVKAKTHEKVDAVGENRAVECHAVAWLRPTQAGGATPTGAAAAAADFTEEVVSRASARVGAVMGAVGDLRWESQSHALDRLMETVQSRRGADPGSSWTAKLLSKGPEKIAKKVGEEAVEVAIAASTGDAHETVKESADLLYHLTVLWASMGIDSAQVWNELQQREGTSGIQEKASRPHS